MQIYATKTNDHHKAEELSGESEYEFMKFRVQQGCLQVKRNTMFVVQTRFQPCVQRYPVITCL